MFQRFSVIIFSSIYHAIMKPKNPTGIICYAMI